MNFKRLLKFTLSGLLLTATATAYAVEGEEPAVRLSDEKKTVVTWTAFANAINNPTSIPGGTISQEDQEAYDNAVAAQKKAAEEEADATGAYETAQKNLTQWQARLASLGNTKAPVEWLDNAYTQADAFDKAFDKVLASEDYSDNTVMVWYVYQKEGRTNTVTISYGENKPVNNFVASPTAEFVQVGETGLYEALSEKSFSTLYIYVGADNYSSNNGRIKVSTFGGNFETLPSNAKAELQTMVNSGDYDKNAAEKADLTDKINALTVADNNGQTGLDKLAAASSAAKATLAEKENALATAQAAYDKAVEDANNNVLATYKKVTLVKDVTATVAINEFDGTIDGGGHVITVSANISTIFDVFSGRMSNVAVNGTIFSHNAGIYNNVAYWNGTNGAFRDVENERSEFTNLAQLGF